MQGVVALTAPQMKQKHFVDEQQQKLEITTKKITQKLIFQARLEIKKSRHIHDSIIKQF